MGLLVSKFGAVVISKFLYAKRVFAYIWTNVAMLANVANRAARVRDVALSARSWRYDTGRLNYVEHRATRLPSFAKVGGSYRYRRPIANFRN